MASRSSPPGRARREPVDWSRVWVYAAIVVVCLVFWTLVAWGIVTLLP